MPLRVRLTYRWLANKRKEAFRLSVNNDQSWNLRCKRLCARNGLAVYQAGINKARAPLAGASVANSGNCFIKLNAEAYSGQRLAPVLGYAYREHNTSMRTRVNVKGRQLNQRRITNKAGAFSPPKPVRR